MKRVIQLLDAKTEAFARAPLFDFLRDTSIEPRDRLSFAPCVAHFVMTFADLYALVLREEPAQDKYQEIVNAHTREDENHWRWFLADLDKLDADPYEIDLPVAIAKALQNRSELASLQKQQDLRYRMQRSRRPVHVVKSGGSDVPRRGPERRWLNLR